MFELGEVTKLSGRKREFRELTPSELFYIEQVTGRTLDLPDRETVEARLARNGIQVGPSELVTQLMASST